MAFVSIFTVGARHVYVGLFASGYNVLWGLACVGIARNGVEVRTNHFNFSVERSGELQLEQ